MRASCFAALVLLVGCGAASGGNAGSRPDALEADWLDGGTAITATALGRVLALGDRDPEVTALVREAETRLGGGKLEGLAARFAPCAPDMASEGGFTYIKSADAWVPRSLEELGLGKRSPKAEQDLADLQKVPMRDSRVVMGPDFILVERTLLPDICIVPRLSLVDAYEAVVHEIVHALRMDPRAKTKLASTAQDQKSYCRAFVLIPGNEVDAYTTGGRARLRLGYRGNHLSPVQSLFDPRTATLLFPPATLGEMILAPRPGGLGYGDGLLRDAFASARKDLFDDLSMKHDLYERVIAERRTNIALLTSNLDIHGKNLDIHRKNLEMATARGDKELRARSRAGVAEAQQGLADTRAMLDAAHASEARLTPELGGLEVQLDALRLLMSDGTRGPSMTSTTPP